MDCTRNPVYFVDSILQFEEYDHKNKLSVRCT